jgi:hypothetical protein
MNGDNELVVSPALSQRLIYTKKISKREEEIMPSRRIK